MRLVTFGCSHTYGEGILPEDVLVRFSGNDPKPSTASWAAQLANKLDVELVNLAVRGTSVNFLANSLLTSDIKQDDIIAILFPSLERFTFLGNKANRTEETIIIPNSKINVNETKKFYELFNDYNLIRLNVMLTDYVYKILNSSENKFVCRFVSSPVHNYENLKLETKLIHDMCQINLLDIANRFNNQDRFGADGSHYSTVIHEILAEDFYEEFTNIL
jgi:hypothetical protein